MCIRMYIQLKNGLKCEILLHSNNMKDYIYVEEINSSRECFDLQNLILKIFILFMA